MARARSRASDLLLNCFYSLSDNWPAETFLHCCPCVLNSVHSTLYPVQYSCTHSCTGYFLYEHSGYFPHSMTICLLGWFNIELIWLPFVFESVSRAANNNALCLWVNNWPTGQNIWDQLAGEKCKSSLWYFILNMHTFLYCTHYKQPLFTLYIYPLA